MTQLELLIAWLLGFFGVIDRVIRPIVRRCYWTGMALVLATCWFAYKENQVALFVLTAVTASTWVYFRWYIQPSIVTVATSTNGLAARFARMFRHGLAALMVVQLLFAFFPMGQCPLAPPVVILLAVVAGFYGDAEGRLLYIRNGAFVAMGLCFAYCGVLGTAAKWVQVGFQPAGATTAIWLPTHGSISRRGKKDFLSFQFTRADHKVVAVEYEWYPSSKGEINTASGLRINGSWRDMGQPLEKCGVLMLPSDSASLAYEGVVYDRKGNADRIVLKRTALYDTLAFWRAG